MTKNHGNDKPRDASFRLYDNLMPLLGSMYSEFETCSKKKPDAVISGKKVDIVNRLLEDILTILDGEPTRRYLEILDSDDLPQNSEVVLMLGQFVAAMRSFRKKYFYGDGFDDKWHATPES